MLQFPYPSPSPRGDQRTVLAKDALFFSSVTTGFMLRIRNIKGKQS